MLKPDKSQEYLKSNMKDHYFLSIRRKAAMSYLVHKGDCPFLHETNEKIFLGTHNSHREAIRAAGRYNKSSGRCVFCMKEADPPEERVTTPGSLLIRRYISSGEVSATWESAFVMSKS